MIVQWAHNEGAIVTWNKEGLDDWLGTYLIPYRDGYASTDHIDIQVEQKNGDSTDRLLIIARFESVNPAFVRGISADSFLAQLEEEGDLPFHLGSENEEPIG